MPNWWVELEDEFRYLFTKRFRAFSLISPILLKISVIPILLTFIYLVALYLLVKYQLNSSLRRIIVTLVTKFYNFDHNRKYFANVFPNDPDLDWSFQNFRKDRLLINFLFSECCKTQFIPSQMFYESWKCQRSCVDGWRIRISSKTTTKRSYSWVIIFHLF